MQALINIVRKKRLPASEIILLRSDVNYTHLFLKSGKQITVAKTLKEMEERFVRVGFFRTHKSFLINPEYITAYQAENNRIELYGGHAVVVSRRRKGAFEKVLN